jgi:hypothetical protein
MPISLLTCGIKKASKSIKADNQDFFFCEKIHKTDKLDMYFPYVTFGWKVQSRYPRYSPVGARVGCDEERTCPSRAGSAKI